MNPTKTPGEACFSNPPRPSNGWDHIPQASRDQWEIRAQAAISAFLSALPKDGPADEEVSAAYENGCKNGTGWPFEVHALFAPYIAKAQVEAFREGELSNAKLTDKALDQVIAEKKAAHATELAAKDEEIERLKQAVDQLSLKCGFPLVDDHEQVLGTVGKMVVRMQARQEKSEQDLAEAKEMEFHWKRSHDSLRQQFELTKGALEAYEGAYPHSAPHDCFATGPLTGDPVRDLLVCPGCRAKKLGDGLKPAP